MRSLVRGSWHMSSLFSSVLLFFPSRQSLCSQSTTAGWYSCCVLNPEVLQRCSSGPLLPTIEDTLQQLWALMPTIFSTQYFLDISKSLWETTCPWRMCNIVDPFTVCTRLCDGLHAVLALMLRWCAVTGLLPSALPHWDLWSLAENLGLAAGCPNWNVQLCSCHSWTHYSVSFNANHIQPFT